MIDMRVHPWGTWPSPITEQRVATGAVRVAHPQLADGILYFSETRPAEGGRSALVAVDAHGHASDVLPEPFSARSRVHEYGGVAWVAAAGKVWFVDFGDQQLYQVEPGERPRRLTREPSLRFVEPVHDHARNRLLCVAERMAEGREPEALLVAVDIADGRVQVLHQGRDFYSAPRLSPDGEQLAWLCWDHPNMPWDGAALYLAALDAAGHPQHLQRLAGGDGESVFQPEFHPSGGLVFVSDRSNWWNLYYWRDGTTTALCPMEAEFGLPLWRFGMRTYAVCDNGDLLCTWTREGQWQLGRFSFAGGLQTLSLPFTEYEGVVAEGRQAALIAASPAERPTLLRLELDGARVRSQPLRRDTGETIPARLAPAPRAIRFPSGEGHAHALYYAPAGDRVRGPADTLPPLLVKCHGGPTGAATTALDLRLRYWTSRGYAVVDVNYRGSTGYGRRYREALYGQWGLADVEDCVNAARYLAAEGLVDSRRMVISGSSAGGYTVLCALCFTHTFAAGASYYGISDLAALAQDTHKFESRYTDALVGPWPAASETYAARSPLNHIQGFGCPVIFFQGEEDRIVPPNQARMVVDALRAAGLPTEYWLFEGEAHGFRRAETIAQALAAESAFYARVLDPGADD